MDTSSILPPLLSILACSLLAHSQLLPPDDRRPQLKPCDSEALVCDEYLNSHTSYFNFYPDIKPRCEGQLQTIKFYGKVTGKFKFGLFAKTTREHCYQTQRLFDISVKNQGWVELNPTPQETSKELSLGIWYDSLETPDNQNPIRYGDKTEGAIHKDFLRDVWVLKMNTELLDQYSDSNGILCMADLAARGWGSFMPKSRIPSIVAQTFPTEFSAITAGIKYDGDEVPKCAQPPSSGEFCEGSKVAENKFYYDQECGKCFSIIYLSCGGTQNLFDSKEECEAECRKMPYFPREMMPEKLRRGSMPPP